MRVATESSPPKPPSRTPAAACQPPWPSVLMQRIGERDPPRLIFSMLYAKLLDSLDADGSVPGARLHPLRREPSSVDRTAARTKAAASRCRQRRRGREQRDKPLHKSRVSQNGLTQRRVGQPGDHGNLDRRHDLPSVDRKGSEAKDTIAVYFNQRL
jgi:hypothetical protein